MSIRRPRVPPLQVTPPQSFTSSPPLTPPPTNAKASHNVASIITEIEARRAGRACLPEAWVAYTLNKEQYGEFLRQAQNNEALWGYVSQKLWYDYIPSAKRFIFRMPTQLHEWLISSVVEDLRHQLRRLGAGDNASAYFAKDVDSRGSPTLDFIDSGYGRHHPDAQFRHLKAQYPGVVLEVSYTQKRGDLARIAEDYILGSDGDIRAVIGLDVEYRNSKRAALSVWRPSVVQNEAGEAELVAEQTVIDQTFRDEEGNPSNDVDAGLCLQLQDFATEALVGSYGPLSEPIRIPASTLCSYLDQAGLNMAMLKQNQGAVRVEKPWVRKRRRQSTPQEELDDRREAKFRKNEEKVMAQVEKDDSSYKTTSDGE